MLVVCYVLGRPPLIRPWLYLVLLALVQSGGVSLAVWMGGVVHELNRMLGRSTAARGWAPIRGDQRVIVDNQQLGFAVGRGQGRSLCKSIPRS